MRRLLQRLFHQPSLITLLGALLLISSVLPAQAVFAETLVLAQVSDRPKKNFKQLAPMARFMARQLEQYGYTRGEVHLFDSADELIEAVRQGKVHWISETPYTAARLIQETDSRALLKKWKNKQRQYQTLIYTSADSGIYALEDLANRRIAFEHADSFSSFLLPLNILEKHGLSLVALETNNAPVPANKVGYVFSRNEKNNALWVDKGIADAGALNNGDWENPDRVPPKIRDRLRIIYRSPLYPRAFELSTPALSDAAANRLMQVLLAMDTDSDAELLARYEKTGGFSQLEAEDRHFLEQLRYADRGGQR